MIINVKASRATDQRGTDYETSDEIHGQHHRVVIAKRMYGHRDQTLEWWALYFRERKNGLFTMYG